MIQSSQSFVVSQECQRVASDNGYLRCTPNFTEEPALPGEGDGWAYRRCNKPWQNLI